MSESGGVRVLTPKQFFESEWYKDGCRQLCADGWPTFIVPVNIQIKKLQSENQGLREAIRSLLEIGKRDLSNPKYDSVFVELREALQSGGGEK